MLVDNPDSFEVFFVTSLFQDLSKLCGVEVAVIIIGDKKTCEYASTDMNRILERYRDVQSGGTGEDTSETARLWEQLETQRRELEALTRELAAEVSLFVASSHNW